MPKIISLFIIITVIGACSRGNMLRGTGAIDPSTATSPNQSADAQSTNTSTNTSGSVSGPTTTVVNTSTSTSTQTNPSCTLSTDTPSILKDGSAVIKFKLEGDLSKLVFAGSEVPVTTAAQTVNPTATTTYQGMVTAKDGSTSQCAPITITVIDNTSTATSTSAQTSTATTTNSDTATTVSDPISCESKSVPNKDFKIGDTIDVAVTFKGAVTKVTIDAAVVDISNPHKSFVIAGPVSLPIVVSDASGNTSNCNFSLTAGDIKAMPPAPTCTLYPEGHVIVNGATLDKLVLLWTGEVSKKSIDGVDMPGPVATLPVMPGGPHNGLVVGPGGSNTCQYADNRPRCMLSASPSAVIKGKVTRLTMTTFGTFSSIKINGVVPPVGQSFVDVTPDSSQDFMGEIAGTAGAGDPNTCTVHVVVSDPTLPPTCTLSSSSNEVAPNGIFTLTFQSAGDAVSATLDGSPISISSAFQKQVTAPAIAGDLTFKGVITGPGGSSDCTKVVAVKAPIPPAPSCTVVSTKSEFTVGDQAVITFSPTGVASTAKFNNSVASITAPTQLVFAPTAAGSYVFNGSVEGPGGSATCGPVTVTVKSAPAPTPAPTCTLAIDKTQVPRGSPVTVTMTLGGGPAALALINATDVLASHSLTFIPQADGAIQGEVDGVGGRSVCQTPAITLFDRPSCTIEVSTTSTTWGQPVNLKFIPSGIATSAVFNYIALSPPRDFNQQVTPDVGTFTAHAEIVGPGGTAQCQSPGVQINEPPLPNITSLSAPDAWFSDNGVVHFTVQNAVYCALLHSDDPNNPITKIPVVDNVEYQLEVGANINADLSYRLVCINIHDRVSEASIPLRRTCMAVGGVARANALLANLAQGLACKDQISRVDSPVCPTRPTPASCVATTKKVYCNGHNPGNVNYTDTNTYHYGANPNPGLWCKCINLAAGCSAERPGTQWNDIGGLTPLAP